MNLQGLLMIIIVFFPFVGAFVSYLIGRREKKKRDYVVCTVTAIVLFLTLLLLILSGTREYVISIPYLCGMGISFEADGFRVVYASIAAFMWLMTSCFSAEYFGHYRNRNRYYLFQLITLGATEAVFLSADLYTTFIFFEIMSFASYVWVAQDEREESLRAAATYLAVAVIGGLVMLMGLFLLYQKAGTLVIDDLYDACLGKNVYVAVLCMFFGFGAKAGAFPLHIWLPKAHPVAPAPASALLSGILTKSGIFGVLVITCKILLHDGMWGTFVLLIGTMTMVAGAVLAVFSIDFKRTLACSSVSQIGFILVGIGMQGLLAEENALAVNGSILHMVNHSLFKLVLFMAAGVIYMNLHKLDLNDIRGFGRNKPLLMVIYLSGALGIGGIPLFSGYVSKTMIHESIVEYMEALEEGLLPKLILGFSDMKIIEWLFLFSGGLTVAYMTKLFVAVFIEKNSDPEVQERFDSFNGHYMSKMSTAALLIPALLFPIMGTFPQFTMSRIAEMSHHFMGVEEESEAIHLFTLNNLKGALISIVIGAIVYLIVVRKCLMKKEDGRSVYLNCWPKHLDLEDYIYRPFLLQIFPWIAGGVCMVADKLMDVTVKLIPIAGFTEASFFDTMTDKITIFMRRNLYTKEVTPIELEEGNVLTHTLGVICNFFKQLLNHTILRRKPCEKDFVHEMSLYYDNFKENFGMIGRSLSYGLLMFCVGLCATLIYLIYVLMSY